MPEIVNAVGGGDLQEEVDLNELHQAISGDEVRYDPEYWPGLYLRFTPSSPAILVFRTGKYNIAGADSVEELVGINESFLSRLQDLGLGNDPSEFEIRNLVLLDRYKRELNLDQIVVALGLENAEYEPEQFPGVLYKPDKVRGSFLIFRNGKVILTGAVQEADAELAFRNLFSELDDLFE
jgi:transcription initiation factor TFIID TATA-box-binding protein